MSALPLDLELPDAAPARPVWLMTLADLALLLVGFFVFLQASQQLDQRALAKGIREGFGVQAAAPATEPMAVSAGSVGAFARGSAVLPHAPDALIAWARKSTRDNRVILRVAGAVDGSAADVDPVTSSGAVLAADRARAVATALILARAVPADRITLSTSRPGRRVVTVTTGFAALTAGVRQ
ncbi:flagellar motor protein MotB [Sphingomonas sp. MMS24-J45]|uniref:flagellar motor protein MotB n=1 Tax=Sphingomonas sp. MMS24-J45 TaxID=3238806 RepID=UPI00384B3FBF